MQNRTSENGKLGALQEALRMAAAEPREQARNLELFRRVAEQIREGDPKVKFLDQELADQGVIDEPVRALIERVDQCFDQLVQSPDPFVWTEAALVRSPLWRKLRRLAGKALRKIHG